ncbi:S1C family serine protease [Cohnella cholangitidis]|uniref:Trypsin-like serine protease n=1 Tax=Cohnella cholangitidis TaxID=2598458 RepID=A0A7G5C2S0_9BACL|nr:trypsin-like peptidase domain-containing protein [Cohnella cholangitidis]QMV43504.1 trypsin-like serine protease [Cohnella cholangitidis]
MDDQYKKPEEQGLTYDPEKRDDPYADVRRESEPYTFGPFGQSQAHSDNELQQHSEQSKTLDVTPTTTKEYRPFTVSGGPARNDWGAKPPKRTSFRAIFASFLVGVVAVGALMFTADRQNWFSSELLGGSSQSQNAAVDAKPVSNSVGNSEDVVRPNNIAKIFEQSSPAVVKIETYAAAQQNNGGSMFDDDFFRQFFGDDFGGGNNGGESGNQGELQPSGMGSGFIFDSTGYILTNQHVIAGASEIKVTIEGHEKAYTAKLLGSSYELDLAVLKIEGNNFPTLKLGDSSSLNMGDWVVAIGNPYGFEHTITVGVLSSNEREISIPDANGTRNYEHLLQTDASINPGNSGGPLLNLKGEVIGINTAVSSQAQGIGFAIPTSTITEVLDNLKNNTKIPQKPAPFIGATLMDVNEDIAQRLGLDKSVTGAFVREVLFNSPAYKADLRQYDVITGMDGKSYKNKEELIAAIQKKAVGDKVKLDVLRGDKKIEINVEIGNKNEYNTQE